MNAAHVDLHIHSNHSDGAYTVAQVLEAVRKENLAAFSIADHDTLTGYREARQLVADEDPELVCGLELSVSIDSDDVHILAYYCDEDNARLQSALEHFNSQRNLRGGLIVEKLNGLGVPVSYQEVQEIAGFAAIARPHIAEAILRVGAVSLYEDAFRRYLANGGPAWVPKTRFTPEEAVALIHHSGGVAVLAHPIIDRAYRHLDLLTSLGLDGIELYHPMHSQSDMDYLSESARCSRLLVTGGSDFHGRNDRCAPIGSQRVPAECWHALENHNHKERGIS